MAKDVLHTAIDVGTTKVCTLVAHLTSDAIPKLIGVGIVPSQGLRKGVVVNIQEAQESIRASLDEAARSAGVTSPWAYAGVTGSHLELFTRWGSVRSTYYNVPLTHDAIEHSIEAATPAELPPEKQVLHLIPQTYAVDGLKGVRNPIGMHALRLDVETLCVVGATAPIQNLIHAVESNRIRTRALVMAGLASGEAALTRDEKEMGVVLVDIGGGATTVAVFQEGTLWNATVLPVGGYQFTTDLAVALNTPYDVAEELKLRHGRATSEDIGDERVEVQAFGDRRTVKVERREVCRYLKDRSEEVLRLAYMKVRSFGFPAMPPAGLVLTGGVANLPGIDKVARQIFNTPARIGTPTGLEDLPDGLNDPAYTTSVGIMLWGIRQHRPKEATKRQNGRNGKSNGHHHGSDGPLGWIRDRMKRVAS